ncbi:MAG TPA: hypothetical protein VKT80_16795 [Chloroflexota bacterium]|nr:hypothetical protein [Chloroflexota bacterium]
MAQPTEHWKANPEEHDFLAAADYLELLLPGEDVSRVVAALKKAETVQKKAKDLSRACRLPLLPADNSHVAQDLNKVKKGARLSPVLLVRGQLGSNVALTIADGYHRICASYLINEDADIPCRLIDAPRS